MKTAYPFVCIHIYLIMSWLLPKLIDNVNFCILYTMYDHHVIGNIKYTAVKVFDNLPYN